MRRNKFFEIDEKKIKTIDIDEMYKYYEKWSEYFISSTKFKVKYPEVKDINQVILAGMGGSGIVGEIVYDLFSEIIDIKIIKDYNIPEYINTNALLIIISVSGNTEETVNILKTAIKLKLNIVTISSNGLIEKISKENKISHNKIENILVPRLSLPSILFTCLKIINEIGVVDNEIDIQNSIKNIIKIAKTISIKKSGPKNIAKQISLKINNYIPVIYTSKLTRSIGLRFKQSLNENSKTHGILEELPELCHNEISCWTKNKDSLIPILIRDKDEPNHIKLRFTFIKNMLKSNNIQFIELLVRGEDKLSRIITGIYILDYVSFYLAILNNINPTTTSNIDNLKKFLKK